MISLRSITAVAMIVTATFATTTTASAKKHKYQGTTPQFQSHNWWEPQYSPQPVPAVKRQVYAAKKKSRRSRPQPVITDFDANGNYASARFTTMQMSASAPSYEPTRQEYSVYRSGLQAREIAVVGGRSPLCARVTGRLSCGCDTATYFGVRRSVHRNGRHDLDLASNWRYLPQSSEPCVGCAAWRAGHVKAIVGGGPGAWRVRDFNSGGGRTHEYVTASLRGYRFAHPADLNLSQPRQYAAK